MPYNCDLSGIGTYCVGDENYNGGLVEGHYVLATAIANQIALQMAIDSAIANGGGIILIPTGTYYIAGQVTINPDQASPPTNNPFALIIMGTGGTVLVQTVPGPFFVCDINVGTYELGSLVFQDLTLQYGLTQGATSGIAIALGTENGSHNTHILRVTFLDCPQAVFFANAFQASMIDCLISYQHTYHDQGGVKPVSITVGEPTQQAIEIYIADVKFESYGITAPGGHGVGGTGMLILSCDQLRVVNCHMYGYETDIAIVPGTMSSEAGGEQTTHLYFGNVTAFASGDPLSAMSGGLIIQPGANGYVSEVVFDSCTFAPGTGTPDEYIGSGILIDPSMTSGIIDQIRFVSCYSCTWPGAGLEIIGGQNIEVVGGCYSCNGLAGSPPPLSAGIAVTGPATGVRIVGAACGNSVVNPSTGAAYPATQDVGVYVTDGANNVIIDSCDLSGNLEYGAYVAGGSPAATSNVFIRNCNAMDNGSAAMEFGTNISRIQVSSCAGYNDIMAILSTVLPIPTRFNGTTFGYYGPVTFYTSAAPGVITAIKIADSPTVGVEITTGLLEGAFRLDFGEWGEVDHTGLGAVTFTMLGN
jgi:hypothetical protein